jgi:peptidoglycan/LPS O-acetylase OafA/YrhL
MDSRRAVTDRSASQLPFRLDIEGLRGIAILAVVGYHVGIPGFRGGFVGVDVFFVLSGYLITALLLAELAATGSVKMRAFYARRALRLLPASAAAVIGTMALAAAFWPPFRVAIVAEGGRAAALWTSNILFSARATDYFAPAVANPLLHTWSLSVEEQFYLVWPTLVLLAAGKRSDTRRFTTVLVLVALVSLSASWWWTTARRPTAFFSMPTRAWEFALGGLIVVAAAASDRIQGNAWFARGRVGAGWLGAALLGGAVIIFTDRTEFPGVSATIPAFGAALIILGATRESRTSISQALVRGGLPWIGRQSYGWYLWHWPLLILGPSLIPIEGTGARAGWAIIALLVAVVSRMFIEDPCRRSISARRHPGRVVGFALAGAATLCVGFTTLRARAVEASLSPSQRIFSQAARDTPRINGDSCVAEEATDTRARICEYGPRTDANATVVLFGDSHAGHWFPALERVAAARQWHLLVLTKSACPAADVPVYEPSLQRVVTECSVWRRAALDSIRARRPSLIIVSSSTQYVLGGPRLTAHAVVTPRDWQRGLSRTLTAFRLLGSRAIIIEDTPTAGEDVPACLMVAAWRDHPTARCDFSLDGAVHSAALHAERQALAGFPEDRLIDLDAALCPHGVCTAVRDSVVLYRDNRHLTAGAARRLAPALDASLAAAGW